MQAYLFCGLLTFTPVAMSILFSLYICYKSEKQSSIKIRVLTHFLALVGFYPQFLAVRSFFQALIQVHTPGGSYWTQKDEQSPWKRQEKVFDFGYLQSAGLSPDLHKIKCLWCYKNPLKGLDLDSDLDRMDTDHKFPKRYLGLGWKNLGRLIDTLRYLATLLL